MPSALAKPFKGDVQVLGEVPNSIIFKMKKVQRPHIPSFFPKPRLMWGRLSHVEDYTPHMVVKQCVGLIKHENIVLVKGFVALFVKELTDPT
jgi:hypothetical protein